MKKRVEEIFIFMFIILSFVFALLKFNNISLILSIVSSIILFFYTKKICNNYFTILTVFCGFHFLYGVSGPISLLWGEGLKKIYGTIFNVSSYLIAYSLATFGLFIGILVFNRFFSKDEDKHLKIQNINKKTKYFFLLSSLLIAFLTSFGELINFLRVGGIETLLKGKAVYQALSGDLFLTIPTSALGIVALALAGVTFVLYKQDNKKLSKKFVIFFIILLFPYLILKLVLGQRGFLLSYLVMLFIIFAYVFPVKKLTKKIILILVIGYFSMALLLVTRPVIKYLFTDFNYFIKEVFDKDKIVVAMNPGTNEFGCTFGNFNKLYVENNYNFLYGRSYLNALTFSIPGFMYLGDKPQSITYQFRDTYFPKEQERSRIAGTAFSSILEAYWNFGYVGVFILYIVFGLVLSYFEKLLNRRNIFYLLFYFSISSIFITFHRCDMGDILNNVFLRLLVILFVYVLYRIFINENSRIRKFIKRILQAIVNLKVFEFIPDKLFLKIKYALVFEDNLDLNNPKTFSEKLQWLKLYSRNSLYTKMVDKYEVREYVKDKIGDEYLIPLYGVYDSFNEIDFEKLPKKFIMKCNHDSGGLIVCNDKSKLDKEKAMKKINKSLKSNFFYTNREWPYKNVKPRIVIEKHMGDDLIDYRFYCFNGKVKLIYQYISESNEIGSKPEPKYCNIYDENWNILPFKQAFEPSPNKYNSPKELKEMIKLSEKLSCDSPFLRVDFYVIDKKIYFGELTFFPGAGFSKFYPNEKDLEIGNMLELHKEKCDKNGK